MQFWEAASGSAFRFWNQRFSRGKKRFRFEQLWSDLISEEKNCQKVIYSRTRKELYAIFQSNVITKSNYVGTKEGLFHETYQYLGVVFYSEKLRHHGLKFEQQQRMQWSTKEMQRQPHLVLVNPSSHQLCVSSQQVADEALSNIHTAEEKIWQLESYFDGKMVGKVLCKL